MNPYNQKEQSYPEVGKAREIIQKNDSLADFKGEELVKQAEAIGKLLSNRDVDLKTSQIRKFLDTVKSIKGKGAISSRELDFRTEAMMIKPKLAYAAGRADHRKNGVKPFMSVMEPCIDRIRTKSDFEQFAKFVEAIVAYHKYYGGKD